MLDFRRGSFEKLLAVLLIVTVPGLPQTKVSLQQLEANGFANGCVVATSGVLSTQSCGSGSAGDAGGYTVITFSSSPVFPATKNTGQSFLLTLTGDVTSSSVDTSAITNSGRPIVTFRLCQDGTGSHVFAWPAPVLNHGTIDSGPGTCSTQTFVFDGTNFQALGSLLVTGASADSIALPGSTSGETNLQAAAAASGILTLPARTATLATTSGALTNGHCAQYDASGNLTDAGAACGSSGDGAGPVVTVSLGASDVTLSSGVGNCVPAETAACNVQFSAVVEDTSPGGTMWAVGNPDRLVAPTAGHYQATFTSAMGNPGGWSVTLIHYRADGTQAAAGGTAGGINMPALSGVNATWAFAMTAGDYIVANLYIGDNSISLNHTSTFFQMMRVGN